MCTVGVPEGEERKGLGKYLKILKLKTSLTWDRKHSSPGSTENAIQDKPKEAHQFTSVQSLSRVRLFATPWTTAHQASLSITNCRSLHKPMSIESVMPSNHLILCYPLLLPPSIFPSIKVFSNESSLCIRWPKYWSFSFNSSPSNEHPGLISLRNGLVGSPFSPRDSQVFSNTTVQKQQFFCAHQSLQSNSHIHTWALEKP